MTWFVLAIVSAQRYSTANSLPRIPFGGEVDVPSFDGLVLSGVRSIETVGTASAARL